MNTQETILERVFDGEYPSTMETTDNGCRVYIFAHENEHEFDFEFHCALERLYDEKNKTDRINRVVVLKSFYCGREFKLGDMRTETESLLRFCIPYPYDWGKR